MWSPRRPWLWFFLVIAATGVVLSTGTVSGSRPVWGLLLIPFFGLMVWLERS